MSVCMCTYARAHLWRSEDKLQESVLSFGHVGPRGQTLVISLDGSLLHLLSHLNGPLLCVHVCMRVQRWVEVCVCVRRSIHRCLQEHVLVQSQHWVFLNHHLLYSLRQVSQKTQNTKLSELIDTATLASQLPPEIPHLPFRALCGMSARDPNPVLTLGAISAVPVSYTCECEQALCLRVSTHACIPWNQRSTSGSVFWLSSTLFYETKFLTYLELTN